MNVLAATSWPDAAVAIAGIAMIAVIATVIAWLVGPGILAGRREGQYRKLVDELAAAQRETTAELQKANEALAQLREQTRELEQGLKEVDRVLKAVE